MYRDPLADPISPPLIYNILNVLEEKGNTGITWPTPSPVAVYFKMLLIFAFVFTSCSSSFTFSLHRASKCRTTTQPKKSCSSSIVTNKYQRHSIATGNSSAPCTQLTQHDTTINGNSTVKMGASSTPMNIVTRRHSATDNYLGDMPADTQGLFVVVTVVVFRKTTLMCLSHEGATLWNYVCASLKFSSNIHCF